MVIANPRKRANAAVCSLFVVSIASVGYGSAAAQMGPKESDGLIGGALLGGIIGSVVGGSGSGSVVGGIAGAAIGGLIGSQIGASLDEQDRVALARATRSALTSGKTQRFSNRRTGVHGTVQLSATSRNSDGKLCRTVQQEVVKAGNVMRESVSACRGPHGWEV